MYNKSKCKINSECFNSIQKRSIHTSLFGISLSSQFGRYFFGRYLSNSSNSEFSNNYSGLGYTGEKLVINSTPNEVVF